MIDQRRVLHRAGEPAKRTVMGQPGDIEREIFQALVRMGPCAFEDLVRALPSYSWNQVFAAVDRLSREGTLRLSHPARCDYQVSIRDVSRPKTRADVSDRR